MKETDKDWCGDWFNSPWYHKLYGHRDQKEARDFISRLIDHLHLPGHARVLDLACGKGRYSVVLNEYGYDVTGIDLSENSIAEAKRSENERLKFFVHDMREVFRENYFDAVFNLFTSFGYMVKDEDNRKVIEAACADLKSGGVFVIDFLNAGYVRKLVKSNPEGMMDEGNMKITWSKRIVGNAVEKEIVVNDKGLIHFFHEMVKLYTKEDLVRFLGDTFTTLHIFGNYSLDPFDVNTSDRLIIIARKK